VKGAESAEDQALVLMSLDATLYLYHAWRAC
jgi:hypothetical protein